MRLAIEIPALCRSPIFRFASLACAKQNSKKADGGELNIFAHRSGSRKLSAWRRKPIVFSWSHSVADHVG